MSAMTVPRNQSHHVSLLLVDDDVELCSLMKEYFAGKGLEVEYAHNGSHGIAGALSGNYDLVILDVMLPVLDGFEVLRQIRRKSATPVLMLTARTEKFDRITGLEAGADDYIPKPFEPDELLARVRAILRRSGTPLPRRSTEITIGNIRLNSEMREVWKCDELVETTTVEFDVLDFLIRAAGRVVSRDELSAVLYQRRATPYERSLDMHVSHLRKKLESGNLPFIRTIRGLGYMVVSGDEPAMQSL